ncbi:MAG: hypothetical protein LBR66_01500 [Candidatus Symbiothrix sp.]|jgi:hypothetical protein|nr:hypothetical protein [Candidatus Symbiothrix sp.]
METLLLDEDIEITRKEFQSPKFVNGIPEGYMTGDEFERRVLVGLKNKLVANGFLQ